MPLSRTLAIVALLVACVYGRAQACWVALDPHAFAQECPVIVSGTIERIDVAPAAGDATFDMAQIRVAVVHRNLLSDVEVKAGQLFGARMNGRNSRLVASTDLRYEIGTAGTWMVVLGEDGGFSIHRHPVQLQRPDKDGTWWGDAQFRGDLDRAQMTLKEWIASVKKAAAEEKKRQAEYEARQAAIKGFLAAIAEGEQVDPAVLRKLLASERDVRVQIAQERAQDKRVPVGKLGQMFAYLVQHDPDANVRAHAATSLGRSEHIAEGTPVLIGALKDPSAEVRLFAVQAMWHARGQEAVRAVQPLLQDPQRGVRMTAARTLGMVGDRSSVGPILELYRRETAAAGKPGEPSTGERDDEWALADALARLGEEDVSLQLIRQNMASTNWNVRYFMVQALAFVNSQKAIGLAISLLSGEVERTARDMKQSGISDRVLVGLCQGLERRTGQKFGTDVAAWHRWWERSRDRFGDPTIPVDK